MKLSKYLTENPGIWIKLQTEQIGEILGVATLHAGNHGAALLSALNGKTLEFDHRYREGWNEVKNLAQVVDP